MKTLSIDEAIELAEIYWLCGSIESYSRFQCLEKRGLQCTIIFSNDESSCRASDIIHKLIGHKPLPKQINRKNGISLNGLKVEELFDILKDILSEEKFSEFKKYKSKRKQYEQKSPRMTPKQIINTYDKLGMDYIEIASELEISPIMVKNLLNKKHYINVFKQ